MATAQSVSLAEYLATDYQPDREWVEGEIRERNVGQYDHSNLQSVIAGLFLIHRGDWKARALTEQRLRVASNKFRVPDVVVVALDYDGGPVIVDSPLLCIEILSPDDRMTDLLERADEYVSMGVPAVWIIDPKTLRVYVVSEEGLVYHPDFSVVSCGDIRLDLEEVRRLL